MIKWGKESWRVKEVSHSTAIIQTRPRKVEVQESRKNSYSTWENTLFSLLEISLRAQTYLRNKWQTRIRLRSQAILRSEQVEIQWEFLDVWLKWITTNPEMKKSKPLPSPNVMDWGRIRGWYTRQDRNGIGKTGLYRTSCSKTGLAWLLVFRSKAVLFQVVPIFSVSFHNIT